MKSRGALSASHFTHSNRRITDADKLKNMRYIEDVVNGLVPSDRHFNTIYALLGKHDLAELRFEKANTDSIADCAAAIARIRMCN